MVEGPPGWIDPQEVKDLVEDGSIVIGPGGKNQKYSEAICSKLWFLFSISVLLIHMRVLLIREAQYGTHLKTLTVTNLHLFITYLDWVSS